MTTSKLSDEEYLVDSKSEKDLQYKVFIREGHNTCTCPAWIYKYKGTQDCKHIVEVLEYIEDNKIIPAEKGDIEIVRANVIWIKEERKILVPLIPFGYEWTDDYFFFIVRDLAEKGVQKSEIVKFFGNSLSGLLKDTSLTMVTRYTDALGETRRQFIEEQMKKLKDKEGM